MAVTADELGTQDIKKLLIKQAVPSSIGILFMSVNILIDTIFVGQWIGSLAIAAVTVVLPITFLISSLGMAIGVGGGSVLSRALGANDQEKALQTFGNQIKMTFLLASIFVLFGLIFSDEMLLLFGAKGAIIQPAKEYFTPIIISVPFLALGMMGNNVIRAEGKAKFAMEAMIIPAFVNIGLDILFIKFMNLGMFGAALATAISYTTCFLFVLWFFIFKSKMRLKMRHFKFNIPIIKEITDRMSIFALFPIFVITQGFLPIAGFNYGAGNYERIKESVLLSTIYSVILATVIFEVILLFIRPIVAVFTTDLLVINQTSNALRWVFASSPIIAIQLIGAAYFQAAGKAKKALLLTLSKQGFFLIPLVLILPHFLGIFGVWVVFPNRGYFINANNWLFSKKRNEYQTDSNQLWNTIIT